MFLRRRDRLHPGSVALYRKIRNEYCDRAKLGPGRRGHQQAAPGSERTSDDDMTGKTPLTRGLRHETNERMLDARRHATSKRLNTRVKDHRQPATCTGYMNRAQEEATTDPELDRSEGQSRGHTSPGFLGQNRTTQGER